MTEKRIFKLPIFDLAGILLYLFAQLLCCKTPFDFLVLPVCPVLCGALSVLYRDALAALCDPEILTAQDRAPALGIFGATILLGVSPLRLPLFHPACALGACFTLGAGLFFGAGCGSACGALLGAVLTSAQNAGTGFCPALALGGFCAGLFCRQRPQIGTLAFLCGALWMLFLSAPQDSAALYACGIGAAPWLLLPTGVHRTLKDRLHSEPPDAQEKMQRMRRFALFRLEKLIPAIASLAEAYEQRAHRNMQMPPAPPQDAPNAAQIEWERQIWMEKVQKQSAQSIGSQLHAISDMMAAAAQSLGSRFEIDTTCSDRLTQALARAGLHAHDVLVSRENDRLTVHLTARGCSGTGRCQTIYAPLISKVLGQPMQCDAPGCICRQGMCTLRFEPVERHQIAVGVARRGADGTTACGDAYAFGRLDGGRFYLILSDGMGTGAQANRLSTRTVSLVEDYLAAGFSLPMTAQCANRYLGCVIAGQEQFATLDLMTIELHSGKMEYLKFGACPSYRIRGETLEALEMEALPLGMFETLPARPRTLSLQADDLIVVLSDGVADMRETPPERALRKLLPAISRHNPQSAAEVILSCVRSKADDCTVLVIRLI